MCVCVCVCVYRNVLCTKRRDKTNVLMLSSYCGPCREGLTARLCALTGQECVHTGGGEENSMNGTLLGGPGRRRNTGSYRACQVGENWGRKKSNQQSTEKDVPLLVTRT